MSNSFAALCDDFYVNMRVGTQMKLAADRATITSFFERMQRLYPQMVNFHQENRHGEFSIEESRDRNSYRWLSVEPNRLSSGYLNPQELSEAYQYHSSVLETVPYYLAISGVDLDYLDVLWGFDFNCKTNQHELIAEALLNESPAGKLLELPGAKGVHFEVNAVISLSEDTRTQARVWLEPRTNPHQIRTGEYAEEMLSLYVIMRQWSGGKKLPELPTLSHQLEELGEKFIHDHVVGSFITPIRDAISRRRPTEG